MSLEKVSKEDKSYGETGSMSMELLFGEIDYDIAEDVCRWILNCNFAQNKPNILNLIINSPGGDMTSAFAIIDVMASSMIPIRTIGLGAIQSAGLMIFLAGTKGERIITPNTGILSHQYSFGAGGKHHELVATHKEYGLTFDKQLTHYKKTTGLSEKHIKKFLLPAEDVYLSADEAVEYGIADRVALI